MRQLVQVLVALGSNLGDSCAIILEAMGRLERLSAAPLRKSSVWRSEPVDCPPGSPPFVNAAVSLWLDARTAPEEFLATLQTLEREFGRRPKMVLNEARPLDLDLIAFGEATRAGEFLTLPHPRAATRGFVLRPLAEVAPDFVLPGEAVSLAGLSSVLGAVEGLSIIESG